MRPSPLSLPLLLAGATLLAGCHLFASTPAPPPRPPALVGADRDAHGCIGSAGYAWCTRLNQCVHPWTALEAAGVPPAKTPDVDRFRFASYCKNPLPPTVIPTSAATPPAL